MKPVRPTRSVLAIVFAIVASTLALIGPSPASATSSVKCESWNSSYTECDAGGNVAFVAVATQHSRSSCSKNHSFGSNGNRIWTNHGCRATFNVTYAGGSSPTPTAHKQVTCESWDSAYGECETGATVAAVSVAVQRSNSACTNGYSYGKIRDRVWVNHGCRATFHVSHVPGASEPQWQLIGTGPTSCAYLSFGTYCKSETVYELWGSTYCDALKADLASHPEFGGIELGLFELLRYTFRPLAYAQNCVRYIQNDCLTSTPYSTCTPKP